MKKITLATIKAFIKKNKDIFIRENYSFDGMTDCIEKSDCLVKKVTRTENNISNTLGIEGAWFVGSSRNYFLEITEGDFVGYNIYNCCGSFDLLVKK